MESLENYSFIEVKIFIENHKKEMVDKLTKILDNTSDDLIKCLAKDCIEIFK